MDLIQFGRLPALRSPVVVAAFAGWNDGAEAATTALSILKAQWDAEPFASIDPDDFYDFTEVRPRVYLSQQMKREVEWPANTFSFHRAPEGSNDIVLLSGVEPQLRWRRYTGIVLDLLAQIEASTLVSLGSLLADVPHTRPVQITGFATTNQLQTRLRTNGVEFSQYEGPTGIIGVLHDEARKRGLASMSLWGSTPYYIAAATNPTVALALLERLAVIMPWELDLESLRQESTQFNQQVDEAIAANPEAAAYVAKLEQTIAPGPGAPPPLPSNDILLRDLEEFLRRRQAGDEGAP